MPSQPSTRKNKFDAARLKEVLHYNPDTGAFTWLVNRQGSSATPGKRAGYVTRTGHIGIGIDRKRFLAHRLAFLYMTGVLPSNPVDHINGAPADNRWCNLREVTASMNAQNIKRAFITNKTSGMLGVSLYKRTGRWQAQITVNNKARGLGYFDTPEEAHAVYMDAKRRLHPGFVGPAAKKVDLDPDWEKFI